MGRKTKPVICPNPYCEHDIKEHSEKTGYGCQHRKPKEYEPFAGCTCLMTPSRIRRTLREFSRRKTTSMNGCST